MSPSSSIPCGPTPTTACCSSTARRDRQRRKPEVARSGDACSRVRSSRTPRPSSPSQPLLPGDRDGTTWPNSSNNPDGSVSFTLGYPLLQRMPCLRPRRLRRVQLELRRHGKFQGTSLHGHDAAAGAVGRRWPRVLFRYGESARSVRPRRHTPLPLFFAKSSF